MGPCVPIYVITGCLATFGVTSARAVLDATRTTVKRDVKETIVKFLKMLIVAMNKLLEDDLNW
jgi:hypothetical protein